jgi:hypothetical protein
VGFFSPYRYFKVQRDKRKRNYWPGLPFVEKNETESKKTCAVLRVGQR